MKFPSHVYNYVNSDISAAVTNFLSVLIWPPSNHKAVLAWPLALPMQHFLSGKTKPFVPLEPDQRHRTPEWWGQQPLQREMEIFKKTFRQSDMYVILLNH